MDIDSQAVEVTKLSLLLKLLEDETQEALARQLLSQGERALPDLGRNIKCGNSLVSTDFLVSDQAGSLTQEELQRINPFNWKSEFPEIMRAGGFDAVIGNPPYIRVRILKESHPEEAEFLEKTYECARHVWDIYLLFFERAMHIATAGGCSASSFRFRPCTNQTAKA